MLGGGCTALGRGPCAQGGLKQKCFFWEKLLNLTSSSSLTSFKGGGNILRPCLDCSPFFSMRAFKHVSYPPRGIVQTTGSQESIGCSGGQGRVAGEMLVLPKRLIHPLVQGLWSWKVGFNPSQRTFRQ